MLMPLLSLSTLPAPSIMELCACKAVDKSTSRSNSGRVPAGFGKGGGGRLQMCLVLPSIPSSSKSADQESHASLPGAGD